jgi:cytidine deaminase
MSSRKALLKSFKIWKDILVLGQGDEPLTPCGACRQRILEFATPQTLIHCASAAGPGVARTMEELLPHAFGPDRLSKGAP